MVNENFAPQLKKGVKMSQEQVCFLPMILAGGSAMVKLELWHEIHSRFRLKESKKSIARSAGLTFRLSERCSSRVNLGLTNAANDRQASFSLMKTTSGSVSLPWGIVPGAYTKNFCQSATQAGYNTVKVFVRLVRKDPQTEATVRFETLAANRVKWAGDSAGPNWSGKRSWPVFFLFRRDFLAKELVMKVAVGYAILGGFF